MGQRPGDAGEDRPEQQTEQNEEDDPPHSSGS
jgi:hypothetical protein